MKDWCSVGEKVAVKGMRGILTVHRVTEDDGVWLSDGKNYCRSQLLPANVVDAVAVTIEPGDYVAVSDITCEAVHTAVVKCFEAAGGVSHGWLGKVGQGGDSQKGLGMNLESNEILWVLHTAQRRLTLQQLFTATNSIRWPDWAVDIRLDADCVYFTDAIERFEMVIPPEETQMIKAFGSKCTNLAGTVLATRNTVSDAELRPAPELGWYDWSADKPRELPPVGERVMAGKDKRLADVKCYLKTGSVLVEYDNSEVGFYDKSALRPANYEQRKANLERDKFIADVSEILCNTYKNIDETKPYWGQYAASLFNAGYRKCTQ